VSDRKFITKILQMCCQNDGKAIFSFIRIYFSVKKGQKRAKRPNTFFKASRLQMRIKKRPKGQLRFFRPVNLKRDQIFEIWAKKGQPDNPA